MNTYKALIAGLALLGWAGNVSAQNETDALRYSRLSISGSARIQGLAGAQTAIGADVGSLAGNPAGLGLFRRSEFSITPAITTYNTQSRLDGGPQTADTRSGLNFPMIGIVIADRKDDNTPGDWRSGTFGFGFTRLNNFNTQFRYNGTGTYPGRTMAWALGDRAIREGRSKSDLDAEYSLSRNNNQFETLEGMAYGAFLFDVDNQGNITDTEPQGQTVPFQETVMSWGSQNQFDFSYGASYQDRLFVGASIGINSVSYRQNSIYRETDTDTGTDFVGLTLDEDFTTSGTGFHGRLGVIYRPSDELRFGASIQTPTFYAMTEDYRSRLRVDYVTGPEGFPTYNLSTLPGNYQYRLRTPMRASAGAAYFFGKNGFVTADVDFVDYSSARLSSPNASDAYTFSNDLIESSYAPTVNVRVGGEARINIFRVRAGYAMMGDPVGNGGEEGPRSYFTGGAGLRMAKFSVDVAAVYGVSKELYSPYTLLEGQAPMVSTQTNSTNVMVTLGVNF